MCENWGEKENLRKKISYWDPGSLGTSLVAFIRGKSHLQNWLRSKTKAGFHMIAKKRLSRCCNFDRCAVSIRSLGSLKKLKMTERDWVKQHLVCAIFKFDMFAVNRRFMLEGCCFLQEPDSTVFLFLKKKQQPYAVLVFSKLHVGILEVACVAGGFVGERAQEVKPRGEWARGKIPLPSRLCRSRALSNKTVSYAGYLGGGGGGGRASNLGNHLHGSESLTLVDCKHINDFLNEFG